MFRELSAPPDLKSPPDDVPSPSPPPRSLPCCLLSTFFRLSIPRRCVFLFSSLAISLALLPVAARPLCAGTAISFPPCPGDETDSKFKKLRESPESGGIPRSLDSRGISGWIRKLIENGALSFLPSPSAGSRIEPC
jgi:hypothetical protein